MKDYLKAYLIGFVIWSVTAFVYLMARWHFDTDPTIGGAYVMLSVPFSSIAGGIGGVASMLGIAVWDVAVYIKSRRT